MTKEKTIHYLFISDESAIATVFLRLKEKLANFSPDHVSLIYFSDQGFIFRKELEVLSRHFPSKLLVYFESKGSAAGMSELRETIEVILNENTRDLWQVRIQGEEELLNQSYQHLVFLGMDTDRIATELVRFPDY